MVNHKRMRRKALAFLTKKMGDGDISPIRWLKWLLHINKVMGASKPPLSPSFKAAI
jgi:hypothetical protein